MTSDGSSMSPRARVIVIANEKGGSGKSTIAAHIAVALVKTGQRVATFDLDSRQRTLTHTIDNRLVWARQKGKQLPTPTHVVVDEDTDYKTSLEQASGATLFAETLSSLKIDHDFIVIDTPGHNHYLSRLAHMTADTLITPLNDSFVDLDVLASVDPDTLRVTNVSHYARTVADARAERRAAGKLDTDWIVLRNRLSSLSSRNKRLVGAAIEELSSQLCFRSIDGLAERVIFREFYPRGLTAIDDLDEGTLGTRPTMSHVTAQLEIQCLVAALLGGYQSKENHGPLPDWQAA